MSDNEDGGPANEGWTGKNLLVLGASGQTGQELVKQALMRGHRVTALVRDPAKITLTHDNLTVTRCDIFNQEELRGYVGRCDVVLSCLGFPPAWWLPVPHFKEISQSLSESMKELGKRRVIFMHSWFTEPSSRVHAGFILRNIFLNLVIGQVLAGMRESELFLETQDHLDYTCVLPPGLNNGPVTDSEIQTDDDSFYLPDISLVISRADVARYMLDVIDDETSFRKVRAIGMNDSESPGMFAVVKTQWDEFKRVFFW